MTSHARDRPNAGPDPTEDTGLDDLEVEGLLTRMAQGDANAAETLFPLVYREMHRIAHRLMTGERRSHTLQTTALVHEAWLRLRPTSGADARTRVHFLGLAARAMRRVLIDHARSKAAKKRAGGQRHGLFDDILERWDGNWTDLLALDDVLEKLGERDADLRLIVELRFYGGLTLEEIGAVLDLSVRQVHRRWTLARGWLRLALDTGDEAP